MADVTIYETKIEAGKPVHTGRKITFPDDCPLFKALGPEAEEGAKVGNIAIGEQMFSEILQIVMETGE